MIWNWLRRRALANGPTTSRACSTVIRTLGAQRLRSNKKSRILIATNVTGFQHASLLEAVLAVALTLRGADAYHFLFSPDDAAAVHCGG